eukprot:GDKI01015492.1.p1 GENE.GDKI01015492.1~~GDKI01015492.1.p1  ORF type:complete len:362 (+),score=57.30 GDKI01015492.1:78-1088(+)
MCVSWVCDHFEGRDCFQEGRGSSASFDRNECCWVKCLNEKFCRSCDCHKKCESREVKRTRQSCVCKQTNPEGEFCVRWECQVYEKTDTNEIDTSNVLEYHTHMCATDSHGAHYPVEYTYTFYPSGIDTMTDTLVKKQTHFPTSTKTAYCTEWYGFVEAKWKFELQKCTCTKASVTDTFCDTYTCDEKGGAYYHPNLDYTSLVALVSIPIWALLFLPFKPTNMGAKQALFAGVCAFLVSAGTLLIAVWQTGVIALVAFACLSPVWFGILILSRWGFKVKFPLFAACYACRTQCERRRRDTQTVPVESIGSNGNGNLNGNVNGRITELTIGKPTDSEI